MIEGHVQVSGTWSVPISAFEGLIEQLPASAATALNEEYEGPAAMLSMCEPDEVHLVSAEHAELIATMRHPNAGQVIMFGGVEPETIEVHLPLWEPSP